MLKFFGVSTDQAPQEEGAPTDLDGQTFAIASDQVGQIAVGGDEKQVHLYRVDSHEDGSCTLGEGSAELAMCFDSPVTKLEYYAGGKLLGVSEDSHVQLMDIESKKVTSYA